MRFRGKLLVLVFCLVFGVSLASGAEDCSVDIEVSQEGFTENTAGFSISPQSGYYYPEGGEWTLGIPIQAENVAVRDGAGDVLDMSISNSTDLFKAVSFENDERVSDVESYRFEISYEMPRGVILYGGSVYMEQYLPVSFCNDDKSVSVDYPVGWSLRNSSIGDERDGPGLITSQSTYQDTLRMTFDGDYGYAPLRNYSKGIFNVSVPSVYSEYVLSKVEELDSFNDDIEELMGIETPEGFHVAYLSFDSSKISEEAAGQYYGGKIEIKSTQLSEADLQHLETLTHELVHGYNDRLSSDSPDWWWEEGTAEYISHRTLEQNGYNVTWLRPSERRLNYTFEKCEFERSFISDWSPVDQTGGEYDLYPCSDGTLDVTLETGSEGRESGDSSDIDPVTDRDLLGYKYSEMIVAEMFKDDSDSSLMSTN